MQINQNEKDTGAEIEDDDNINESYFNDRRAGTNISSLAENTSLTPSNCTKLSYHTDANLGVEYGDNSPTRKRKITLDAWSTIKRIKNDDFL